MNQTWAVARQTIAEGVRMKLAIVFLVLIGMVVLGLPFSVAGDRSLAGAVQSFLSYALAATGVLLGLLTIFMSRSLSDEFVERQLFLIVTKPIPRWQFVLGKWVGIVLLNAVFLGFAGLTTYAMVKVLQRTHPPIDAQRDARELANEVLVARHAVRLTVPDFSKSAEAEFQRNLEEGVYAATPDLDLAVERARLERKHEARWRVVGPYEQRRFEFYSVLCDRSAGHELQLRYKTNISHYAPDEIFRGAWRFGNSTQLDSPRTPRGAVDFLKTVGVENETGPGPSPFVAVLQAHRCLEEKSVGARSCKREESQAYGPKETLVQRTRIPSRPPHSPVPF